MRLTVGPLPPAVYWRRRAVVLGAVLLFVIVVAYSCNGTGKTSRETNASATPTVLTPETGPPTNTPLPTSPTATASEAPADGTDTIGDGGAPADDAAAADICTDAEMLVTPVPSQTTMKVGGTIMIHLKIKNISDRTCRRDVGADLQELYIAAGARKIWSSDTCGTAKGSDVRSFAPDFEREYRVAWNGKEATECLNGVANGDWAEAGKYQVFGRLGTKLSKPAKLVISD